MAEPIDWQIQRFDPKVHDRAGFDCGKPPLTEWLIRYAGQHERRGLARVYVMTREGDAKVIGYYALSSHAVGHAVLPAKHAKGLPPRIDVPVILIGRLAVDRSVQGRGLGETLLANALQRALYVAERIGVRAVEVDAIDDQAKAFYSKRGFLSFADDPGHLFLPVDDVKRVGLRPLD